MPNKINIASDMFMEAHQRYVAATRDIDFIVSILLSGAVLGIVSPLLKEQGGVTRHSLLARLVQRSEGIFRASYNSLKHAGDTRRKIAPSSDLDFDADLKTQAARMLGAAKHDFCEIVVSSEVKNSVSQEFRALLESDESYA